MEWVLFKLSIFFHVVKSILHAAASLFATPDTRFIIFTTASQDDYPGRCMGEGSRCLLGSVAFAMTGSFVRRR